MCRNACHDVQRIGWGDVGSPETDLLQRADRSAGEAWDIDDPGLMQGVRQTCIGEPATRSYWRGRPTDGQMVASRIGTPLQCDRVGR